MEAHRRCSMEAHRCGSNMALPACQRRDSNQWMHAVHVGWLVHVDMLCCRLRGCTGFLQHQQRGTHLITAVSGLGPKWRVVLHSKQLLLPMILWLYSDSMIQCHEWLQRSDTTKKPTRAGGQQFRITPAANSTTRASEGYGSCSQREQHTY